MDNEYIVSMPICASKMPFEIQLTGITYEDPNYSIERFSLNTFTVEYVMSGVGYIEANGERYTAEEGDTYILGYGMKLHYYSDKLQPWRKIWFNAGGTLLNEAARIYGLDKRVVFKNIDTYKYLSEILKTCENNALNTEEKNRKCAGIYIEMLGYIAERAEDKNNVSGEAAILKKYIDSNIEKNITVSELAKLIYRSESQTIRIFKKSFNKTPYEYLLDNKITRAGNIIQSTNVSIKELAYRLGFCDEHYFSSVFKKRTGYTPTDYRKIR